jgi:hypothetical protein
VDSRKPGEHTVMKLAQAGDDNRSENDTQVQVPRVCSVNSSNGSHHWPESMIPSESSLVPSPAFPDLDFSLLGDHHKLLEDKFS